MAKKSPSLALSTCVVGGLQVVWAIIMANGTPHLLSLSIPAPLTPLIWLTGPITGTLLQPLLGALSDARSSSPSSSPWRGGRRPLILLGALLTSTSLLLLAWTRPLALLLARAFTSSSSSPSHPPHAAADRAATITATSLQRALAPLLVLALNASIQPVQVGMRALIAAAFPTRAGARQASAWCGAWTGVGSLVGYAAGSVVREGVEEIGGGGMTRFQVLAVVAAAAMLVSAGVTCGAAEENEEEPCCGGGDGGERRLSLVGGLGHTWRAMSRRLRALCWVQFWAWMGWFPFLYYAPTYVDKLHRRESRIADDGLSMGSYAGFMFTVVSLFTTVFLVAHSSTGQADDEREWEETDEGVERSPQLAHNQIARLWTLAHAFFFALLWSTILVRSWRSTAMLIAYTGIPWAMTQWVPYAIIGEEAALQQEGKLGSIIGLHNVAISAPQILSAGVSAVVLWAAQSLGSEDGIGWLLRIGACAAVPAIYAIRQL